MKKVCLLAVSVSLILYSCSDNEKKNETAPALPDPLVEHIDSSYVPADNFFFFANNNWFKSHPIPSSENSNGIFRTIGDTVNEAIRKICESAATAKSEPGSNKQKIGDFYFSGMDTAGIEKAGLAALNTYLEPIDKIKNIQELLNQVAEMHKAGIGGLFEFGVTLDSKNSSKYALYLMQCSLGLPERDYYFSERTQNIRDEYVKHISKMFALTGMDEKNAALSGERIMKLETALAKACRKMEDLRDPYKNYNKMTPAALTKISPSINWSDLLSRLGINGADTVIVGQPEFFSELEKGLKQLSLEDWKLYLKWNAISSSAAYLNNAMEKEDFYFNSTVLEGVKEQKPRWKRTVETTNQLLGELIGQVYVEEYLPKGTKEKLLEIGNNIRNVFADHIKRLDWMSEQTKEKALSKLGKINMKVGYPDKWKDLSSVSISRDSYFQNVMNVAQWRYQYMINKYGKPIDKTEWFMYPQTYNAYYEPTLNEICVPGCNIIVPGFEGRMPDDAVLYGIIGGSTFGHEITHGFDDQGSQYDESGNLKDWWTKEDREKFIAKTRLIVDQYNQYVVLDSLHLNGENTQGENIADLGGVIMGYEAFLKTPQAQSDEKIGGYTPVQRYFLAYAYAWMVNTTDALMAKRVLSNEHSPAEFRVTGPLSNFTEFYNAFQVKPENKMYRPDSLIVRIW